MTFGFTEVKSERTVRATVGKETFIGEIVDSGHDGVPYTVVEDKYGDEHVVRPSYPTHELHAGGDA